MARLAIMFSGFTRDHPLNSIRDYLIVPNLRAGHEIDIYASAWETTGIVTDQQTNQTIFTGVEYWSGATRSYSNAEIDKPRLEAELLALTSGRVAVKYRRYEDYARRWLEDISGKFVPVRGKDEHTWLRASGMWSGMMDVFSMVERPERYDILFRCRFDMTFHESVVVEARRGLWRKRMTVKVGRDTYEFSPGDLNASEHIKRIASRLGKVGPLSATLLVPVRSEIDYVDDWFAIGTPPAMRIHMNAYRHLREYFQDMYPWPEPFENESITVYNALKNGVGLRTFPKTITN